MTKWDKKNYFKVKQSPAKAKTFFLSIVMHKCKLVKANIQDLMDSQLLAVIYKYR